MKYKVFGFLGFVVNGLQSFASLIPELAGELPTTPLTKTPH